MNNQQLSRPVADEVKARYNEPMLDTSAKLSPEPTASIPVAKRASASERRFLLTASLVCLLLASSPYLIGYWSTRRGVYCWAGTSPSDYAVYLAWMRAAADGQYRDLHLFAAGRPGMLINPVYWILGKAWGVSKLPAALIYHAGRIVFGAALLYVLWRFIRICTPDPLTRRLAFLFLCFSSGFGWCLGWLPLKYWSVDRWQPEAFTFLSLYSYPHFCVSLMLQVAILGYLMRSVLTGRRLDAVFAGICGSLLAVVHTYDIISIALVWIVYALAPRSAEAAFPVRSRLLASTVVAGALTAPGLLFMYLQMRLDAVFAERAAFWTASTPLYTVIIGYGGILILGVFAVWRAVKERRAGQAGNTVEVRALFSHPEVLGLLSVWAMVNVLASYIPVPFQRKMLQGEHVPLCILAAVGAAWLIKSRTPNADGNNVRPVELALAGFLAIGSFVYLYHDTRDIVSGVEQKQYRSALLPGEVDALSWVERHTPPRAVVQPIPWVIVDGSSPPRISDTTLELFLPGMTGRSVYVSHWDETPDYDARTRDVLTLAFTPTADRAAITDHSHISYLIFSQKSNPAAAASFARTEIYGCGAHVPDCRGFVHWVKVYGNRDADIYAVEHE